jgi:DNA-binding response OmpR family regulator
MSGGNILVVEDDPAIRDLLCQVLELFEFACRASEDGNAGLRQARDWLPDAMVLDVMLPDVDGYEVCRILKGDASTADIGVLMLTALQSHADRVRGFQAGADRFFTKPFQPDEIARELRALVGQRRHRREDGLRRQVQFDFASVANHHRQVGSLQQDLLRATPLCPADIEAAGDALVHIGQKAVHWQRENQLTGAVRMTCKIFRDRLEYILSLESSPGHPAVDRDTFLGLFDLAGQARQAPITEQLADTSHFSQDANQLTLTRKFALAKA